MNGTNKLICNVQLLKHLNNITYNYIEMLKMVIIIINILFYIKKEILSKNVCYKLTESFYLILLLRNYGHQNCS